MSTSPTKHLPGAAEGPCKAKAAATGGGVCAVGPPLSPLPCARNDEPEGNEPSTRKRLHDGEREIDPCLPPIRFLDATECLWNAFLRLGNLAIVNCVSVISSHPIELDTLKEAALLIARRNQALRLVIRLTDIKAVARHQAQEQTKYRLQCEQQWQFLQRQSSSDDLLGEDSVASCSSRDGHLLSSPHKPQAPANPPRRSSFGSSKGSSCRCSNGKRSAWRWVLGRSASQFAGRPTARDVGTSKGPSCSLSSGSESEGNEKSFGGILLPCKCRRRGDVKFTFHERLGEPVVDVKHATIEDSFSSSGLAWQTQQKQPHVDLGLLEEHMWMKAMAREQKIPFNCEDGPLWRLRLLPSEQVPLHADQAPRPCTPTSPLEFNGGEETSDSRNNTSVHRFRTRIIGVFHHSTIDGLSRKEFWDELFRCVISLGNAKRYSEYAAKLKALSTATRVAAQLNPNYQQPLLGGNAVICQTNNKQPSSISTTATQTLIPSPVNRWRRGSSNSSNTTTASSTLCYRRGSAGSTSASLVSLEETESNNRPFDSPSANSWSYIRRLSAVSAGSVDSAATYPIEESAQDQRQETDATLAPPRTVLPPALNELFKPSAVVTMLRPIMYPGGGFHVRLYLMERQFLRALRNPFAAYYPSKRFRASGTEYEIYKAKAGVSGFPDVATSPSLREKLNARAARVQPCEAMSQEEIRLRKSTAFTGVITLHLSKELTAGLLAACKERKMTMNGLITTAAAVALARMLWRRHQVMQQHSLLAELSRDAALATLATAENSWSQERLCQSLWDAAESLLGPANEEIHQSITTASSGEKGGLPEDVLPSSNAKPGHQAAAWGEQRVSLPPNWGKVFHAEGSGECCSSQISSRLSEPGLPRLPSVQELLGVQRPVAASKDKWTKETLPRSAASRRNSTCVRSGWPLSHMSEMLRQLMLRSPVSGEGFPGTPNRQFARHRGPVYIYTLQAVSGRRWLDNWLQEQENNPGAYMRGRRRLPSDDRRFEEFLLQSLTASLKGQKCSRAIAALAAASAAASVSRSPSAAFMQVQLPRSPFSTRWGTSSSPGSRSTSGSRISSGMRQGHQRNANESGTARHQGYDAFFRTEQQAHRAAAVVGAEAAVNTAEVESVYRRARGTTVPARPRDALRNKTSEILVETTGHSSISTASSLQCTRTSSLSTDSLGEDIEKSAAYASGKGMNGTSCYRRLQAHTRSVCNRISTGLQLITQWLWGPSSPCRSTEDTPRQKRHQQMQQQQQMLPAFGLGSYALLMPLKLRVPVECDEGGDAVWALGKACTDSVHEFASLANPSFATLNFQLISHFVEEVRGELKCLTPFKNDAFARPSVFLISNGGVWSGELTNKFKSDVHSRLRDATVRHHKLLQRTVQQQLFWQQMTARRQTLPSLPWQLPGTGTPDATLRIRRQVGGRKPSRSRKGSSRTDGPSAASPVLAAAALRNSNIRGTAAEIKLPPNISLHREKRHIHHQQSAGGDVSSRAQNILADLEGLLPSLELFDLSVESSWSIVSQHVTGLNYFAHNCVTVGGKLNWSLQYHSNLTSREIAALYAAHILEVLREAHAQHIHAKASQ